jgi:hypothetical protein
MRCRRLIAYMLLIGASSSAFYAQNATPTLPTYFPPKVFADLKHNRYMDGKLQDSWFGAQLFGLQEPPLIGRSHYDEPVYRFTLLPSFGHPVVVRVSIHQNGTATVVTRVGKGAGGYGPKGMLSDHSSELPSDKVQVLKDEVALSNFGISQSSRISKAEQMVRNGSSKPQSRAITM